MKLKIVQAGDPVLRKETRPLTKDEILSPSIQQLIESMRDTMREAPGVGLAAPQIGESIQLAVIEDRAEYISNLSAEQIEKFQRFAVPFHVIINPKIFILDSQSVKAFEGCLSVAGFQAVVPRALNVIVDCLNERGEEVALRGHGWYARILQHEIDHLMGSLYIDRMNTRTFTTVENAVRFGRRESADSV